MIGTPPTVSGAADALVHDRVSEMSLVLVVDLFLIMKLMPYVGLRMKTLKSSTIIYNPSLHLSFATIAVDVQMVKLYLLI